MKKKYVLKNKRRFLIVIAVLLSIICSTLIIATTTTKGYSEPVNVEIVVEPGDTLWDIVCEYYGNNVDVRRTVAEVKRNNSLTSSELRIGQVLLLPVR
ncbi:MAG TPA: LysM peptidoglycan-binding domain-containing protein [Clostridia bacterium]|nr:LysM peptidoglycan-binding domain-containing protein [Clostridia bacterium]HPQ45769.1 LysM peptidoglycan-binding domain-containing protein [Clostridia bacterium]HRX41694.1 LysM peptidoglycan-binding domain-containing protein [Clostridia bacterium]